MWLAEFLVCLALNCDPQGDPARIEFKDQFECRVYAERVAAQTEQRYRAERPDLTVKYRCVKGNNI